MYFWSIKRVYFLQNANNLDFKLLFKLYAWPKKQVFCLNLRRILDNEPFWLSLRSTFLASKFFDAFEPWFCHTVTNGPDLRKFPPVQAGLLPVFSRQQDYNSGELLWDLHLSDHGQRGLLRLQPAHEICGFWVQSNFEAYAGILLFSIQTYFCCYIFQSISGAVADSKVWKAASRVDQGLRVLIDRNMDRLNSKRNW